MVNLTEEEKQLAIKQIMDEANKKYGKGFIVKGADAAGLELQRLRTGSLMLDLATGGGWAMGKINELYGKYSSGKSFLAQLTVAQTQRDYPEREVVWIDFEGAFDAKWAKKIGVDTDSILITSPEFMEDGLQLAVDLIHSKDVSLIVIDSLAAAQPKSEGENEVGKIDVGTRAKISNKFVRKTRSKVDLTLPPDLGNSTILVLNQTYMLIGSYGDPDVTPCGEQMKFGAMLRVKIRKGETTEDKSEGTTLMQEAKFTVVKNKTFPPHTAGSFWFSVKDNPKGKRGEIYRAGEVITCGMLTEVIRRAGPWYYLPEEFGDLKFQGEQKVAEWADQNPEDYKKLEEIILREVIKL
jgi:recombination protein RecA